MFSISRAVGEIRRVQIPRDIWTRFARFLYSTKQSWITNTSYNAMVSSGILWNISCVTCFFRIHTSLKANEYTKKNQVTSGIFHIMPRENINRLRIEPWPVHCVVLLGKTLFSHSASLYPGVKMGTGLVTAGGWPCDWQASYKINKINELSFARLALKQCQSATREELFFIIYIIYASHSFPF